MMSHQSFNQSSSNLQHLANAPLTFQDAVQLLQQKVTRRGINYALNRLTPALSALDNPHLNLPKTIHIAGTNGKGSVAHGLSHALIQHGQSVVSYTSPHIQCYTERFQLNGAPITKQQFSTLFQKTAHCDRNDDLSEYEYLTLMAFMLARDTQPDVLILETGLGGRLDATNVVPTSMAVITDIGLDHTQILGPTLSDIAEEKAGIIKPNALVVTHLDHPSPVLEAIKSAAKHQNATLHWATPKQHFQNRNLALVQTALSAGFEIEPNKTTSIEIPIPFGRLSSSSYHGTPCIMDVGHNAHAVSAILSSEKAISEWIIGIMQVKDIHAVLEILIHQNQTIRLCEYDTTIAHTYNSLSDKHKGHVSLWVMGDPISPNSLFFGSFTFIEALLHEAIK
jgi:folylpolyglutamate synthase/dihydropteroate synthase